MSVIFHLKEFVGVPIWLGCRITDITDVTDTAHAPG
jgi:hypothetical protein